MSTLTDEQWALVTDNLRLVYSEAYRMVQKGHLLEGLIDDAISEGIYGLVKAASIYDPTRGMQFSTLAVTIIRNQIRNLIGREFRQARVYGISLDDLTGHQTIKDDGILWEELVPAPDDTEQQAVDWLSETIRAVLEERGMGRHAQLLIQNAAGATMEELARGLGVTKQRVSKQIIDARKVLREAMSRAEWTS